MAYNAAQLPSKDKNKNEIKMDAIFATNNKEILVSEIYNDLFFNFENKLNTNNCARMKSVFFTCNL